MLLAGEKKKAVIYNPGRELLPETNPEKYFDLELLSFRTLKKINSYLDSCLSHLVRGIWLWQP